MEFDRAVLVTGAGGQLGLAFADLIPEEILLEKEALDITKPDAVLDAVMTQRPEVIINAAAFTRVDQAEDGGRAQALEVNTHAVHHLAEAANRIDALLVQPSTDYVFSGAKEDPYTEEDAPDPVSVYGVSKLGGEREAARAKRHLIVRTSWMFGEGRNFIGSILDAADRQDELKVVDDQRGLPTYAVDLADGILKLMKSGAEGLFHLCGGGDTATWADVAEHALSIVGKPARLKRVTTEEFISGRQVAPRPKNSVLDCSKAEGMGVKLPDWRDAVKRYIESAIETR